jgi:hypothetical protein
VETGHNGVVAAPRRLIHNDELKKTLAKSEY